jgi:hypothetical protein
MHYDRLLEEAQAAGYTLDRYRVALFEQATRKNFTYQHHVAASS